MMLQFEVETPEGNLESVTSNDVAQSFAQKGFQNVSISPDGMMISMVDANGVPGQIDVEKFVAGNSKIAGIIPQNVNYQTIDQGLRASIGALGNHDDLKQKFLEGQLREKGLDDVKVLGSGSNFYYFDPKTGSYNALTNKPGADLSDISGLTEYASGAAGLAGSALGGVAGATASAAPLIAFPGANIAAGAMGGAAGSAAGGWAARGLVDSAAKMLNPKLKPFLESEEIQGERNFDTAMDAVGGGVGGVISKLPLVKRLFETGLASNTTRAIGKTAKGAGYLANEGAGYLGSDALPATLARGVAENFVPITGQMQLPALAMRSPELIQAASKKAAELYGKRATNLAAKMGSQEVKQGGAAAEEAIRKSIETASRRADKLNKARLVPDSEETIAQKFASGVAGMQPRTQAVRQASPGETFANLAKGTRGENIMKGLQKPIDMSVQAGRGIDKVNSGVVKGTLKGIELGGAGLQRAGAFADELGTAFAPLENRLLMQGALQSDRMKRRNNIQGYK